MTAEKDKKLHADAKEFVPSWLNATTKPAATKKTTAPVKSSEPAKKTTSSEPSSGKDKKAPPAAAAAAKNGTKAKTPATSTQPAKTTSPTSTKSDVAAAKPTAPPPKPAAPPVVAAWGAKPSEAVKKAAPIKPQQKPVSSAQQRQQSTGGKPGNAQRQQSSSNGSRDNNGRRGGGDNNNRSNNSGRKNDQAPQQATGSWARAAAKPATAPQRQQSGSGGGHNRENNNNDRGGGHNNNKNHRQHSGRQHSHRGGNNDRNSGGGGGGDQGNDDNNPNWSRGKAVPKDLLDAGEGETDAERAVKRINVHDLLDMRLDHIDPPATWDAEDCPTKPSSQCLWDAPTRVADIETAAAADRIGGDVSRVPKKKKPNPNDTAPALEDCKPLEVNDETRWKAKVMDKDGGKGEVTAEVDSTEEILRKATLILNKLSLTKFDKLSDEFIACGIGRDVETLTGAVGLIVNYAQEQQHFSSMYAGLCLKLANTPMEGIDEGSKKGKKFKKILLERCQTEFETDTSTKIKEATKGVTDAEEIEYHSTLIKKHYLGHMRFIGELYKGDLISIKIMLHCLPELLHGDSDESPSDEVDEEKVECFSKLMTVIGSSLEQQSAAMKSVGKSDAADSLAQCWRTVEIMAGKRKEEGPKVSNRMKFMLQDLLEMKSKGWVARRKEETAKTLAQIHKEVAKEERASARKSQSSASLRGGRREKSSGDVRKLDKEQAKPQVDADGFVSVAPSAKGVNRSVSMTAMHKSQPKEGFHKRGSTVGLGDHGGKRSSQSKFAVLNESDSRRNSKKGSSNKLADKAQSPPEKKPKVNYLAPDECGDKATNILKEYFVGGDADDAVLSIHELVGAGDEGSLKRGTKVVESAVLLVLEMKQQEVDKFVGLYLRCAKEKKIEGESFVLGLNDPLEFLADVAVDAPMAIPYLVGIVAELVKADVISFNFLLNAPEYFRSDQNASSFGAKVMKKIGGDAMRSEDYIEVIEKLMTDNDKATHNSVSDLIEAA